ncbi:MAG: SIS domain-containing protein [Planctomycetes bacterium]|nr:SIS domain-containing protein [Planctomycetota bacterium]
MEYLQKYRARVLQAVAGIDIEKVRQAVDWLGQTRDAAKTIYTCGNGGSAMTASHLACDLLKGASYGQPSRFRVLALTDPIATMTAYANDVSYSAIFVEQLKNFAAAGDVLIAISGSGNSPNVVEAARFARSTGCRTIGLTGRDGGKLGQAVELNILVPEPHMGIIEDAHMIICHMIGYHFMDSSDPARLAAKQ